jgi:hypothetical protein
MPQSLQSSYRVIVNVDGHRIGQASSMTGGAFDSDETKFRSAGTEPQTAEGGLPTTSNVTVFFKYDPRQHDLNWLRDRRGWADMDVSKTKLERTSDGWHDVGDAIPYSGKLKAVTPIDYDANGTTVDTFSLELSADGS